MVDSTFSRNQLQAYIDIKKGKMMSNWVKRLCVVSGTRLLIHKGKIRYWIMSALNIHVYVALESTTLPVAIMGPSIGTGYV